MKRTWSYPFAFLLLLTVGACTKESAGKLAVEHAWSRPTAEGMSMGVAYLEIVNRGKSDDTLLTARSPACERVEFHRTVLEDGMARMRPEAQIAVPGGATVKAEPEGLHLMLVGLKQPLLAGSQFPLTLRFEHAGEVAVRVMIETPDPPSQ